MYELETGNIIAASDDAFIDKFLATQTKVLTHTVKMQNEETGKWAEMTVPVFSDQGEVRSLIEFDHSKFGYLVATSDSVVDFANRDVQDFVVKVSPIFYGEDLTQVDAFRGIENKIALVKTIDNNFVESVVMRKLVQDETQIPNIIGEFEFPENPEGGYHQYYMMNFTIQNGTFVENPPPENAE